jgi:hypothetical protein
METLQFTQPAVVVELEQEPSGGAEQLLPEAPGQVPGTFETACSTASTDSDASTLIAGSASSVVLSVPHPKDRDIRMNDGTATAAHFDLNVFRMVFPCR